MLIPNKNAFTINRLGLEGSFFPFSLEVSQKDDITSIFICAQRVVDLCDLIEKHSLENLVIFDVGQVSRLDKLTNKAIPIKDLATNANIPFSAIDSETIVLPKERLLTLLSTFDHYNLSIFDIRNDWSESQVISQVLAYREQDWRIQEAVLPKLTESRILLKSHDDCYITIESYSPDVSKDVFIRALQIYTGTVLARRIEFSSQVSEFPIDLLNIFWKESFALTILERETEIRIDYLKIGVSKHPYNFREKVENPEFWIVYEVKNQKWFVQA